MILAYKLIRNSVTPVSVCQVYGLLTSLAMLPDLVLARWTLHCLLGLILTSRTGSWAVEQSYLLLLHHPSLTVLCPCQVGTWQTCLCVHAGAHICRQTCSNTHTYSYMCTHVAHWLKKSRAEVPKETQILSVPAYKDVIPSTADGAFFLARLERGNIDFMVSKRESLSVEMESCICQCGGESEGGSVGNQRSRSETLLAVTIVYCC